MITNSAMPQVHADGTLLTEGKRPHSDARYCSDVKLYSAQRSSAAYAITMKWVTSTFSRTLIDSNKYKLVPL
jgi:hypothetical protein